MIDPGSIIEASFADIIKSSDTFAIATKTKEQA
jgi:hypothetical protein